MEKTRNNDEQMENNNEYSKRKYIFLLIVGIAFGFCVSQLIRLRFNFIEENYANLKNTIIQINNNNLDYNFGKDIHHTDDMTIANKLHNEVKVLCWILTKPDNHKERAQYISKTWGKRCNKILIISSKEDKGLEIIGLPVKDELWNKTKEAFKYIHENHIDDFDWFLSAHDDTYVIMENLRFLLYGYDSRTPIFFGHKSDKGDYMVSGAGYVLSKEALNRFIEIALPDPEICHSGNSEVSDIELGKCLQNVGVIAGNSLDAQNRSRFHGRRPEDIISGKPDVHFGYWSKMYYETFTNKNCCSDDAISFHGIVGKQMYVLEYLIYHLRPYGIERILKPLPKKKLYYKNDIAKTESNQH